MELIVEFFKTRDLVMLFTGILAFAVVNFKGVFETFEKIKSKYKNSLLQFLEINCLDSSTTKLLHQEVNRIVSKEIFGTSLDLLTMKKITEAIEKSDGKIQLLQIKNAARYIRRDKDKIFIKIDKWDHFEAWFNRAFSIFFLVCAGLLFYIIPAIPTTTETISGKILIGAIAFTLIPIAASAFLLTAGYSAAKSLKTIMDEIP